MGSNVRSACMAVLLRRAVSSSTVFFWPERNYCTKRNRVAKDIPLDACFLFLSASDFLGFEVLLIAP